MLKKYSFKSEFFKNVMVLTSGTVLSQVISFLLIPIITRLYSPDDMAELGLFMRIVGVGSAIATFRYELALPVVKNNSHAFRLYRYAVKLTILTTLISGFAVLIPLLLAGSLNDFLFYISIPLGIGFTAYMSLGTNWALRLKMFKQISVSKLINSVSTNLVKVVFGLLHFGYIGLIISTVFGLLCSIFFFARDYFKNIKTQGVTKSSKRNFLIAKQFSEFPKINLPHTLLDMARDLFVALIIWQIYGQTEYGYFSHTYQMLRFPLTLIGASISQVFFQRCAEKLNKGIPIFEVAKQSVYILTLISFVPFGFLFFWGEEIFTWVFGLQWKEAGQYAEIMSPWLMMNFILSPIGFLPLLVKKQKLFFICVIFGSIMLILTLYLPYFVFQASIFQTLWIVSITQSIYFFLLIILLVYMAKNASSENAYN